MDWTDIFGYAMLFLFGLVVGRVWGRASAVGGGNMLTSHQYPTNTTTAAMPTTNTTTAILTTTAGAPRAADAPDAGLADAPGAALEAEIRQLAASGNLLQAIKVYKERTGCGLREARDGVARICGI